MIFPQNWKTPSGAPQLVVFHGKALAHAIFSSTETTCRNLDSVSVWIRKMALNLLKRTRNGKKTMRRDDQVLWEPGWQVSFE